MKVNRNPPQEGGIMFPTPDIAPLWTVDDFGKWFHLHPDNVYKDVRAGKINHEAFRRRGRAILFLPDVCDRLFRESRLHASQAGH